MLQLDRSLAAPPKGWPLCIFINGSCSRVISDHQIVRSRLGTSLLAVLITRSIMWFLYSFFFVSSVAFTLPFQEFLSINVGIFLNFSQHQSTQDRTTEQKGIELNSCRMQNRWILMQTILQMTHWTLSLEAGKLLEVLWKNR